MRIERARGQIIISTTEWTVNKIFLLQESESKVVSEVLRLTPSRSQEQ